MLCALGQLISSRFAHLLHGVRLEQSLRGSLQKSVDSKYVESAILWVVGYFQAVEEPLSGQRTVGVQTDQYGSSCFVDDCWKFGGLAIDEVTHLNYQIIRKFNEKSAFSV